MEYHYKADKGKLRLSLVDWAIVRAIARVRMYGVKKYPKGGKDNWLLVDNGKERYKDALLRHTMAFFEDEYGNDAESGLPHLWQLATNVMFLCRLYEEDLHPQEKEPRPVDAPTLDCPSQGVCITTYPPMYVDTLSIDDVEKGVTCPK